MRRLCLVTVALAFWAAPAYAQEPGEDECVAILGDETDHEENELLRRRQISSVLQAGDHVSIVYFEHQDEPARIAFRGLELVEASIDTGVAVVRIDDEAELGCTGEYEIIVDDSIGRDTAVVAVLDDVVLLDHEGELRYLAAGDEVRVDWNLIWRSRFSISIPKGKASRVRAARRPARRRRR